MRSPPVFVGDRVETLPHVGVAVGVVLQVKREPGSDAKGSLRGPVRYLLGLELRTKEGGLESVKYFARRSDFVILRATAAARAVHEEEEERRANRNRKGPR